MKKKMEPPGMNAKVVNQVDNSVVVVEMNGKEQTVSSSRLSPVPLLETPREEGGGLWSLWRDRLRPRPTAPVKKLGWEEM